MRMKLSLIIMWKGACIYSMNDKDNILKSTEKDIELAVEKLKLEDTLKIINAEILNYISKRKYIADYIMEYRKNVVEEYKEDEDKVAEYFDHERYVKEEAFKTIDRRLKELTALKLSPYFGKVTFEEEGSQGEEYIYIGKFGLMPEDSYEPVIIDWRAPVASLFYAGTLGKVTYNPPEGSINTDIKGRRQFIIKKAALKGMFDSALDVKDEILQMVLSSNSSDKLKDIIMTLQKEQDNIIRSPKNQVVVVNGVAGSGKTTIALHRIAYLLYNYRAQLQDKVLILGPNSIFMEYISNVLPSLGEEGVKQRTFSEFAEDILQLDKPVMDFKEYIERILSGDKEFIEEIRYKSSSEYKNKLEEKVKDLNENYFEIKDAEFKGEVVVDSKEIREMFFNHYSYMPLFRRSKKIKRIIISKIKDKRDIYFREIQNKYKSMRDKLSLEQMNLEWNNIEMQRRIEVRDLIMEVVKAKESLRWLDTQNIESIYDEFNNHKALIVEDLAPMLYLKHQLEGIKLKQEIKHVVIDEAQDYTELQFEVIKAITGCKSFTIVGDSNQKLIPLEGKAAMLNMEHIFNDAPIEYFNLNKSYRSTQEIMTYANQYLDEDKVVPFVRSGEKVETLTFAEKEELALQIKDTVTRFKEDGYESIAIICRNEKNVKEIKNFIKDKIPVKIIEDENIIYNGGVVLIPSYYAKGLEFDAAIVVDDLVEKDKTDYDHRKDSAEDLVKYIMCTRALHVLKEFRVM